MKKILKGILYYPLLVLFITISSKQSEVVYGINVEGIKLLVTHGNAPTRRDIRKECQKHLGLISS